MRWLRRASGHNGKVMRLAGQYDVGSRLINRYFRHDPFRSFLILSLVIHLLFLISWPRPRSGRFQDISSITVELVRQKKPSPARRKVPEKHSIPRKKTTVSKTKRILVAKKPAIKKTAIRKKRPAARKNEPDLSQIRRKLAKEKREKAVSQIKNRLAKEKPVRPTAALSVAGSYQLNRYAELLKAKITDNWKLPELLLKEKLTATIAITIDASGRLVSQQPEKMSGNQLFDDSIIKAIARSAPFPRFPPAMSKDQEEFVLTFDPNDKQ